MKRVISVAMALSILHANSALAGPKFIVQPVQVATETVRFNQGEATVDLQLPDGAVQITPLGLDHGSLTFGVVIYNGGKMPANIDVSNFVVSCGAETIGLFSREQLEAKAKNRAMWASIAVAAVAGLSAASAASARDTYTHTMTTPRGTYRSVFTAPSATGQIAAAAATAGGVLGVASIQNQLDATRAMLGETTLQLTTVDPGETYGGRIVLHKIKSKSLPQRVSLVVNWNGREYPFAFQLAKKGTPQPVFTTVPAAIIPNGIPSAGTGAAVAPDNAI